MNYRQKRSRRKKRFPAKRDSIIPFKRGIRSGTFQESFSTARLSGRICGKKTNQLPNPHWIYPGQKLRLFLKDGVARFEVVETIPSDANAAAAPLPNEPAYYRYSLIDQVGFIRTPAVEPHGVLFKSKDNKKMISQGDMVYIRPEGGHPLLPGQKYTVYQNTPPIWR